MRKYSSNSHKQSSNNFTMSNGFGFKEMNNDTIMSTPTPLIASTMKMPMSLQDLKSITISESKPEIKQNDNSNQIESIEFKRCDQDIGESRKSSLGLLPSHCLSDPLFEVGTPSFMKKANSQNFQFINPNSVDQLIDTITCDHAIFDNEDESEIFNIDEIHNSDQKFDLAFGRLDPAKSSFPLQFQKQNDQQEIQRDFNLLKNKMFTPSNSDNRIPSFYWRSNKEFLNQKEINEDTPKNAKTSILNKELSFNKLSFPITNKTGGAFAVSGESNHKEKLLTKSEDFGKSFQFVEIDKEEFSSTAEVLSIDEKDFLKEHQITEDMNLRPSYINSCEMWRPSDAMEGSSKNSYLECLNDNETRFNAKGNLSEKSLRMSDYILQRSSGIGALDGLGTNRPTFGMKIKTPPTSRKPIQMLPKDVIEQLRIELQEKNHQLEYDHQDQVQLDDDNTSNMDRTLLPFDLVEVESSLMENDLISPNKIIASENENLSKTEIMNVNCATDLFEKENDCNVLNTLNNKSCVLPSQNVSVNDNNKNLSEKENVLNESSKFAHNNNSTILNISHFIEKVNSVDDLKLPDTIVNLSNAKWMIDRDPSNLNSAKSIYHLIGRNNGVGEVKTTIANKELEEKGLSNYSTKINTDKINPDIFGTNTNTIIDTRPVSDGLELINSNYNESHAKRENIDIISDSSGKFLNNNIGRNLVNNVWQLNADDFDNAVIGSFFNQRSYSRDRNRLPDVHNTFNERQENVCINKTNNASKANEICSKNKRMNLKNYSSDNMLINNLNSQNKQYLDCINTASNKFTDGSVESRQSFDDNEQAQNINSLRKAQHSSTELSEIDEKDRSDPNDNVFDRTLMPISNTGFRSPRLSFIIPKTKRCAASISPINDITLDEEYNNNLNYIGKNIGADNFIDLINIRDSINLVAENILPLQICRSVNFESNRNADSISLMQSNLLPIQFEKNLKFMDRCCVGTVVKLSFIIYNPNKCSINVCANLVDTKLPKRNYFMLDKTKISISANSGSKLEISYAPLDEGEDEAHLYLYTNSKNDNLFSVVSATSEFPNIKIISEDGANYLDFQYIPLARRKNLKVVVENKGMAPVPLHLSVKNSQDSNEIFLFVKKVDDAEIQQFSSCHCSIEPFNSLTLSVIFQAPAVNSQNANKISEFSGKIEVELDNVNEKVAIGSHIGSLVLVAKTGIARLHIPNSLEIIQFKCAAGKKRTETLPLVNKGFIPLNISFELNSIDDSFIISPCEAYLPVNEAMNLNITFCPNNLSKSMEKLELLLLMTVEPDGPIYEIPIVAEIIDESSNCRITQKNLFASSDYICFFKYDLKSSDEKLVLMNNSRYEMRLFLEILNDTPGHLFKFVADVKSNFQVAEKLISSRIIMIGPKSSFQLLVRFLANGNDLNPAFGRLSIKGEGSDINSVVLLYAYCQSSNVILEKMSDVPRGEILLNSNNCAQLSLINNGNRTAFVFASVVAVPDLTEQDYVIEPLQFCLKPSSQRFININIVKAPSYSIQNPTLLTLTLFTGDEILRHLYKNIFLRSRKSQQNLPNLPTNIHFDSSIDNEEEASMHQIYANLPDRMATHFSNALNCTVLPVKMRANSQNNLLLTSDLYAGRMLSTSRPTTPPRRERPTSLVPQLNETSSRMSLSNSLIVFSFPFANIENSHLLFTRTTPSSTSNKSFNISNNSDEQLTWSLSACSPTFFKEATTNDNRQIKEILFRVKKKKVPTATLR